MKYIIPGLIGLMAILGVYVVMSFATDTQDTEIILASGPAYFTCIPHQCSQTLHIFSTWRECAEFQRYQGSQWKPCTIYK
jgi:uncharacterized membrane protein YhfC